MRMIILFEIRPLKGVHARRRCYHQAHKIRSCTLLPSLGSACPWSIPCPLKPSPEPTVGVPPAVTPPSPSLKPPHQSPPMTPSDSSSLSSNTSFSTPLAFPFAPALFFTAGFSAPPLLISLAVRFLAGEVPVFLTEYPAPPSGSDHPSCS